MVPYASIGEWYASLEIIVKNKETASTLRTHLSERNIYCPLLADAFERDHFRKFTSFNKQFPQFVSSGIGPWEHVEDWYAALNDLAIAINAGHGSIKRVALAKIRGLLGEELFTKLEEGEGIFKGCGFFVIENETVLFGRIPLKLIVGPVKHFKNVKGFKRLSEGRIFKGTGDGPSVMPNGAKGTHYDNLDAVAAAIGIKRPALSRLKASDMISLFKDSIIVDKEAGGYRVSSRNMVKMRKYVDKHER